MHSRLARRTLRPVPDAESARLTNAARFCSSFRANQDRPYGVELDMHTKVLLASILLALLAGFALGRFTHSASAEQPLRAEDSDAHPQPDDTGRAPAPMLGQDASPSLGALSNVADRLTRVESALTALRDEVRKRPAGAAASDNGGDDRPDYTAMPDGQVQFAAQRLRREGKHQGSLDAYLALRKRMDDDHPEWIDTSYAIASLYEKVGRPKEAEAEYVAIEEKIDDPGSLTVMGARWSRGLLRSQQGDYEGARKLMLSVGSAPMNGRADPNHLKAWGRLRAATYAGKLGNPDTAREELLALQGELAGLEEDDILKNIRKGIQYGLSALDK